jgi:adenylate kinase family enzyme
VKKRVHIFGASGTGTSTLARALAGSLGCRHFDTDNYYWLQTDPPFKTARECTERQELLRRDLNKNDSWVLSGSLCGWGDFAIPLFDLVVFLWLPPEVRLQRLKKREIERYGPDIESPDNPGYQGHAKFLAWATAYDTGGLDMRSRARHEEWITTLRCPVIRIEIDRTIQENLKMVLSRITLSRAEDGMPGE